MTIRAVVKMGNQQLATPSVAVSDFSDPMLAGIINDMRDTMLEESGVGIAAPQIGQNIRVVIFGFEENTRYPDEFAVPFTVLINPEIKILSDEMVDGWEGCLSVPGLRGLVPRYNKIQYQGFDLSGNFFSTIAEGFHARVVQHECDHLDGILYPQRMVDMSRFAFQEEALKYLWKRET